LNGVGPNLYNIWHQILRLQQKISTYIIQKTVILSGQFNIQEISKSSEAGNLAKWCKAMYEFAEAYKIVAPKEAK